LLSKSKGETIEDFIGKHIVIGLFQVFVILLWRNILSSS